MKCHRTSDRLRDVYYYPVRVINIRTALPCIIFRRNPIDENWVPVSLMVCLARPEPEERQFVVNTVDWFARYGCFAVERVLRFALVVRPSGVAVFVVGLQIVVAFVVPMDWGLVVATWPVAANWTKVVVRHARAVRFVCCSLMVVPASFVEVAVQWETASRWR